MDRFYALFYKIGNSGWVQAASCSLGVFDTLYGSAKYTFNFQMPDDPENKSNQDTTAGLNRSVFFLTRS